jgi:aminoglycoside phosphotransferase family enzyme/predicted kinase
MPEMDRASRVVETHVSTLFFLDDLVYKLKKPVSTGFLDFSARQSRQAACHREVELNRRLAPDVYLGVADISMDGEPCDNMVVMRRLPEERRLAHLVTAGVDVSAELRSVARLLAAFHSRSERSEAIDQTASPQAVLANWEDNFDQMQPFAGAVFDQDAQVIVEQLARRYLAGRERLLLRRMAEGKVCDGHGDLQAEDIFCLADEPRILDCIEFDDRLRGGDVLADVAFLAMDLERLGEPNGAGRFLAWYREFAGETWPTSLAHHYIAYRAHVRAKVACLRHAQGDPGAALVAAGLLGLARRHLERGQVTLTLVGGLPGTGKSTLAEGIADERDWSLLRSDEIRKDLAGVPHSEPSAAPYGEGLYSEAITAATYREMLLRAGSLLELGESVVLDASWNRTAYRDRAAELALATSSELVQLRCVLDPAEAALRISRRRAAGGDPSDADSAIAIKMAADSEPWVEAEEIDTSSDTAAVLHSALVHLGGDGW